MWRQHEEGPYLLALLLCCCCCCCGCGCDCDCDCRHPPDFCQILVDVDDETFYLTLHPMNCQTDSFIKTPGPKTCTNFQLLLSMPKVIEINISIHCWVLWKGHV